MSKAVFCDMSGLGTLVMTTSDLALGEDDRQDLKAVPSCLPHLPGVTRGRRQILG